MSSGDWAAWTGAAGTVIAVVAAVVVGLVQLRVQRRLTAVERTIQMQRDFTTGETGDARGRLSRHMARTGRALGGEERYHQPRWEELVGRQYMSMADGQADLSLYPPDMQASGDQTPLRDIYKVLWALERIAASYRGGLLDRDLAFKLLARHVVWWHLMCEHLTADQVEYVTPLKELAAELADERLLTWARTSFLPSAPAASEPD
ncbi:hypothetical protein Cs7R123_55910 [Catellatospora sp. TT07R-123]|uniref:hypothetical protein n=1 Tax=Catellatospora sp. TT07R-123 TaxID=2733863 RepID=UPI001B21CA62|nr:hypothetical protein [Catellatospora sp. TT07R-123]GHJ48249.1 hypothetical protein Cs7R123_55910 [Catellatospora sp. TT07R-123]